MSWRRRTDVAQPLHDGPSIAGKMRLIGGGSWNTQQDQHARDYVYNKFKELRLLYLLDNADDNNPSAAMVEAHRAGYA